MLFKKVGIYCKKSHTLCKLGGVSRAAYYKWLNREISENELENQWIATIIERIHNESPDKDYRRIRDELERYHGIDVNDKRFLNPESMIAEVLSAASEKGVSPKSVGELIQCVYQSLAECYADAIRTLSDITGKTYTSLNIVGGGCQDKYLNALTADSTGIEVFAGPVEGTAIGNLNVQMIAGGEFANLTEARAAIM